jgi:DNA repair protein RecO (recombination protein O)
MPTRERSIRVEAVVLRHMDWGEADRLLWLFTRELGKVRVVAKGVRKLHSRKAGHLEPFTLVGLLLARGRELMIVTQAEAQDTFTMLHDDLLLMGYASYVVELLDRFTYEEGQNIPMYHLLADTLARLCTETDSNQVIRYYEVRLLDLLGFRPQLFHCALCGNEIQPEDQFFSAAQGGALCPSCGLKTPGARPISMQALKYLRHYQRSSFTEAKRAHPNPENDREMEMLMQHYLTYLLERSLNTPEFLRRVKQDRIDGKQTQSLVEN